jgi:exo beta-1,2-glucooligosaccharide sophorohydrolase (non-reducing end)
MAMPYHSSEAIVSHNYRSGLLWKLFMSNPEIAPALEAIGFRRE